MDVIKNILSKTSGAVTGILYLCFIFVGFCSIILAHIGLKELTDIDVNWFIFFPAIWFLYNIPIVDIAITLLSLYGGYTVCEESTFAMIVFVLQCVSLIPFIVLKVIYLISMIINIKFDRGF